MFHSGYFCDKCGLTIDYKRKNNEWLPGKTHLIAWARRDGWSIGKVVLCPRCRKNNK